MATRKLKGNHKQRICILRSNPVSPDSRVEKEAGALKEAGYFVHIIGWDRERNHKAEISWIQNHISITRYGYKAGYGQGVKSLKARMRFQLRLAGWLIRNGRKFDAVHACDIDTAMISYIPARLTGCRFVFDIFDFVYAEPHNFFQWIVKQAQLVLVNNSDAVIICSEQRKKQIKDARPKRLAVIHNTPDETAAGSTDFAVDKNRLSVVYVGILPRNRLLGEMISHFKKHPDQDIYIGGFGLMEDEICKTAEKYSNIHYLGQIPYNETLALERQCDVMAAAYDLTVENYRMAAPNKFYESLMLGKPIIMTDGMGMSEEVSKNDIGVLIDYSEEGFSEGLRQLAARKDEWAAMGVRARKLYDDRYSWNTMKTRLVDLYTNLLGRL